MDDERIHGRIELVSEEHGQWQREAEEGAGEGERRRLEALQVSIARPVLGPAAPAAGSTIPVKFVLTEISGNPISGTQAAALTAAGNAEATLAGSTNICGYQPVTAPCAWNSTSSYLQSPSPFAGSTEGILRRGFSHRRTMPVRTMTV